MIIEIRPGGDRPRIPALAMSVLLHGVAVSVLLLAYSALAPKVAPVPLQTAELTPARSTHLTFGKSGVPGASSQSRKSHSARATNPLSRLPATAAQSGEAVQREAREVTADMMRSLKFTEFHSYYPGHQYQLPVRQSGELPHISAEQFPSQISQMVAIDITINSQGKVIEAHIAAGEVQPEVKTVLLAAVSELRYIPAKRDNVPVASQLEIIVSIPS